MSSDFQKYDPSAHPQVKLVDDYNNILDHALEKAFYDFIIGQNGSYFEVLYGKGPNRAGTRAQQLSGLSAAVQWAHDQLGTQGYGAIGIQPAKYWKAWEKKFIWTNHNLVIEGLCSLGGYADSASTVPKITVIDNYPDNSMIEFGYTAGDGAHNPVLRNLVLDGNAGVGGKTFKGINGLYWQPWNCLIENVTVRYCTDWGISWLERWGYWRNVRVIGCTNGIYLHGFQVGHDILVSGNGGTGFMLDTGEGGAFRGIYAIGNQDGIIGGNPGQSAFAESIRLTDLYAWMNKHSGLQIYSNDSYYEISCRNNGGQTDNTYNDIELVGGNNNSIKAICRADTTKRTKYGLNDQQGLPTNILEPGSQFVGMRAAGLNAPNILVSQFWDVKYVKGVNATPFDNTNSLISIYGTSANPLNDYYYIVTYADIYLTVTGGTGVTVEIYDAGGTLLYSGSTVTNFYCPKGFQIHFLFTTAPTIQVSTL
jgi:hypothetical protein